MAKTFALGTGTKVMTWCEGSKKDFTVINGGWRGSFENDTVKIRGMDRSHHAELLWEGEVPSPHNRDYNDAIAWIEGQLA